MPIADKLKLSLQPPVIGGKRLGNDLNLAITKGSPNHGSQTSQSMSDSCRKTFCRPLMAISLSNLQQAREKPVALKKLKKLFMPRVDKSFTYLSWIVLYRKPQTNWISPMLINMMTMTGPQLRRKDSGIFLSTFKRFSNWPLSGLCRFLRTHFSLLMKSMEFSKNSLKAGLSKATRSQTIQNLRDLVLHIMTTGGRIIVAQNRIYDISLKKLEDITGLEFKFIQNQHPGQKRTITFVEGALADAAQLGHAQAWWRNQSL